MDNEIEAKIAWGGTGNAEAIRRLSPSIITTYIQVKTKRVGGRLLLEGYCIMLYAKLRGPLKMRYNPRTNIDLKQGARKTNGLSKGIYTMWGWGECLRSAGLR